MGFQRGNAVRGRGGNWNSPSRGGGFRGGPRGGSGGRGGFGNRGGNRGGVRGGSFGGTPRGSGGRGGFSGGGSGGRGDFKKFGNRDSSGTSSSGGFFKNKNLKRAHKDDEDSPIQHKKPNGATKKFEETDESSDDEFPITKNTPKGILKTPGNASSMKKKNVVVDAAKSPELSKTPVTPHPSKGIKATSKSLSFSLGDESGEVESDSDLDSEDLDSGDFAGHEDGEFEDELEDLETDEEDEEPVKQSTSKAPATKSEPANPTEKFIRFFQTFSKTQNAKTADDFVEALKVMLNR